MTQGFLKNNCGVNFWKIKKCKNTNPPVSNIMPFYFSEKASLINEINSKFENLAFRKILNLFQTKISLLRKTVASVLFYTSLLENLGQRHGLP